MGKKILIVDRDEEIRKIARMYLENEGHEVLSAENGEQALKAVYENEISLILVDVKIFAMNWIEAFLKIRKNNIISIIFMYKEIEDFDYIQGFQSVTGDYIIKPFNAKELIKRINSQLIRYTKYSASQDFAENRISIGKLTIDSYARQILIGKNEVRSTPKEFEILSLLASNRGMIFSTEKIYKAVWGNEFCSPDNTVMVHIRKLRKKIEDNPRKPIYIKTVWGVGYKI